MPLSLSLSLSRRIVICCECEQRCGCVISYLLGVVATQRLVSVGAADQELPLTLLGQDPDVVLTFVL